MYSEGPLIPPSGRTKIGLSREYGRSIARHKYKEIECLGSTTFGLNSRPISLSIVGLSRSQ